MRLALKASETAALASLVLSGEAEVMLRPLSLRYLA